MKQFQIGLDSSHASTQRIARTRPHFLQRLTVVALVGIVLSAVVAPPPVVRASVPPLFVDLTTQNLDHVAIQANLVSPFTQPQQVSFTVENDTTFWVSYTESASDPSIPFAVSNTVSTTSTLPTDPGATFVAANHLLIPTQTISILTLTQPNAAYKSTFTTAFSSPNQTLTLTLDGHSFSALALDVLHLVFAALGLPDTEVGLLKYAGDAIALIQGTSQFDDLVLALKNQGVSFSVKTVVTLVKALFEFFSSTPGQKVFAQLYEDAQGRVLSDLDVTFLNGIWGVLKRAKVILAAGQYLYNFATNYRLLFGQPPVIELSAVSSQPSTGGPSACTVSGQIHEFTLPNTSGAFGGQPVTSIAAGTDGNLWFTVPDGGTENVYSSTRHNVIGRVTPHGDIQEFPVASVPLAITRGPDGNMWYVGRGATGSVIGKITPAGIPQQYPFADAQYNPLFDTYDITLGPDHRLWFTGSNFVGASDTTGHVTEFPEPSQDNLIPPTHIVAGADGNLWFTEANHVVQVSTGGAMTPFHYTGTTYPFRPDGIATGPDGALWVTDNHNSEIGRVSYSGNFDVLAQKFKGDPFDIVAGPDGNMWFTEDEFGGVIGRLTPPGGGLKEYPIPSNNTQATAITVGPDGNIWFTEFNGVGCVKP